MRAFEAGFCDRFKAEKVKAVVIWIIPDHLARVTGDGAWLGASPRYVLEDGKPRFTGSFTRHRWINPLAGLRYQAGKVFSFVDAIGMRRRQETQAELLDALIVRLEALAREKLNAPLIVVYSWPDEHEEEQPLLTRLHRHGIPLLSVDELTAHLEPSRIALPYDGHPTPFVDGLIAGALKRRLQTLD